MRRKAILILIVINMLVLVQYDGSNHTTYAASPQLDLRAFPVLPTINGSLYLRMRTLVVRGKRTGNRLNVFSKIGDSITAWTYFLTPVGAGGAQLGGYDKLQEVVAKYSGEVARTGNSFVNQSLAAQGGWTSSDLLDPAHADPGSCAPGETPLSCELRVTKPSVALIMIGTNDLTGNDVALFKANLNRILTIVERANVIPVVSTIPFRRDDPTLQDRVPAFDDVIIRMARLHNVPLWNYWLAVEDLPSNGVSVDGIHPSLPPDNNTAIFDPAHLQFGFTMRNLTALQVLQRIMPALR